MSDTPRKPPLHILLRLAADLLDEHAERLGRDGCNDWNWPDWFPAEAREPFVREMERLNGTPEEADEGVAMYATLKWGPPNWWVSGALADMLREHIGALHKPVPS